MDYPIAGNKSNKLRIWKEFQLLDIIPYSLAIIMLSASIYIVVMTIELTRIKQ